MFRFDVQLINPAIRPKSYDTSKKQNAQHNPENCEGRGRCRFLKVFFHYLITIIVGVGNCNACSRSHINLEDANQFLHRRVGLGHFLIIRLYLLSKIV